MKNIFLILFSCTLMSMYAQYPNHKFSFALGDNDIVNGHSIATDNIGNVFISGSLVNSTVDFDPGPSTYNLTSSSNDLFLAKYTGNGQLSWAFLIKDGGFGSYPTKITIDNSGNLYVAADGFIYPSTDFDPGPGTFTLNAIGKRSCILAKYTSNGQFLWVKPITATPMNGLILPYELAISNNEPVLACTSISVTAIYPNAASSTFSINTNYSYNGLLVKYNSSGQFQWSKLLGGNLNEWLTDIATDNTGNIYATGVFYSDSVDFKPTSGSFYLKNKSINGDAFMAKYDATGNLLFAHNFGGASSGIASNPGITIDSNNDIYFCFGYLPNTSTADFDIDPDTSKYILTAGYNIRMVLAKYNSNCKFYWGKEIITFGNNGGSLYNICLDNANSVYLVGNLFDSYCDFDPSPNTNLLSGGNEFYIAKYTSNADLVWALDYDPDAGTCYDIAYHNSGHIYAIGYFHSDTGIDLDPGPGTSILTSGTSTLVAWSAFVVKYTIGGLIGVDELNQDTNNLSLFPNPAKDYLNINSKDNSEFEIYSIDGKLLEVVNTKKTKNVRIDVSNYSEGMYFLLDKSSGTRSKFVIYR